MIERKFITEKIKEHNIREFLKEEVARAGYSKCDLQKTPLGMKVIIYAHKPGIVVGRGGESITELSDVLKNRFGLKSPQIEVREVQNPESDAQIMADRISMQLLRFGVTRFKAIGHRTLQRIMDSGVLGAEIKISGKVPGKRARFWRFNKGYLPKSGETSVREVQVGFKATKLKPGIVGVTVSILPAGVKMPDDIRITEEVKIEEGEEELPKELEKAIETEKPVEEKPKEEAEKKKEAPKPAEKKIEKPKAEAKPKKETKKPAEKPKPATKAKPKKKGGK